MTEGDVLGQVREAMRRMQAGPLIGYMPYTCHTEPLLRRLAELKSSTPQEFDAFIRSEIDKWGKVIRAAGLENTQ